MTCSEPTVLTSGGAEVLFSRLLLDAGVPHGFSTRRGGVSRGMFESLNFGNPGDLPESERDPRGHIESNWVRLKHAVAAHVGDPAVEERRMLEVHQVHGATVCVAMKGKDEPPDGSGGDVKADAIVTDDANRLAAVRVADCTPVLIASADAKIVAAVHAGWRGVVGGVAPRAVGEMVRLGADAGGMIAAIGPCIGPGAFEVGGDVAIEFERTFGEHTPYIRAKPAAPGKWLVDLQGAIREQLVEAGLASDRIDVLARCTVSEPGWFFSHRGERGRTGRMVGVIGPRAD